MSTVEMYFWTVVQVGGWGGVFFLAIGVPVVIYFVALAVIRAVGRAWRGGT